MANTTNRSSEIELRKIVLVDGSGFSTLVRGWSDILAIARSGEHSGRRIDAFEILCVDGKIRTYTRRQILDLGRLTKED